MSERSIEDTYGVRTPTTELWQYIEASYGNETLVDIKDFYKAAQTRYQRAVQLNQFAKSVAHRNQIYKTRPGRLQELMLHHYQIYCLAHKEDFINGEILTMDEWEKKIGK